MRKILFDTTLIMLKKINNNVFTMSVVCAV